MKYGKDNFAIASGDELVEPSTVFPLWQVSDGDKTFIESDCPRFITSQGDGTITMDDWATPPNNITRNVSKGQPIACRPKKIYAVGTDVDVILEY
jgi:hypothetical protein